MLDSTDRRGDRSIKTCAAWGNPLTPLLTDILIFTHEDDRREDGTSVRTFEHDVYELGLRASLDLFAENETITSTRSIRRWSRHLSNLVHLRRTQLLDQEREAA